MQDEVADWRGDGAGAVTASNAITIDINPHSPPCEVKLEAANDTTAYNIMINTTLDGICNNDCIFYLAGKYVTNQISRALSAKASSNNLCGTSRKK